MKLRMTKMYRVVLILAVLVAGASGLAPHTMQTAKAASCGDAVMAYNLRPYVGYFTGGCAYGTDGTGEFVIFNGGLGVKSVNSLNDLRTTLSGYINGSASSDKTGAEFIVLTMLGENGGPHAAFTAADYTKWATLIGTDGTTSGGWTKSTTNSSFEVNFNYASPFHCGSTNSFYRDGDDAFYPAESGNGSNECGTTATVQSIAFRDASTHKILYTIKKNCGNPIGNLEAIPPPPVVCKVNCGGTGTIEGKNLVEGTNVALNGSFKPTVSLSPANEAAQSANPFKFTPTAPVNYKVSVPGSFTISGKKYTAVRATWCDATAYSGCGSYLTAAKGSANAAAHHINFSTSATVAGAFALHADHTIDMRWFWKAPPGNPGGGGPGCDPATDPLCQKAPPCPTLPAGDKVTVTIQNTAPADSGPPPAFAVSKSSTFTETTPDNKFNGAQVVDTSNCTITCVHETIPVSPTSGDFNGPPGTGTATVTLDYSQFAADYPYDVNTTVVQWYNLYHVVTYKADTTKPIKVGGITVGYKWKSTSTAKKIDGSTAGPVMQACYPRAYQLQPHYDGSVAIPNYGVDGGAAGKADFSSSVVTADLSEAPTSVTITDPVSLLFNYTDRAPDQPTPRVGFSVNNVDTQITGTVYHSDGSAPTTTSSFSTTLNPSTYGSLTDSTTGTWHVDAGNPVPATSYTVRLGTNVNYGDAICFSVTVSPGSGQMDSSGAISGGSGTATSDSDDANGNFSGSPHQICTFILQARPYLQVYGGDTAVGGALAGDEATCRGYDAEDEADVTAGIITWNQGSAGGYAGSADQFGVEAYNTISGGGGIGSGFSSAMGNGGNASPPRGLSLANTTGPYGGNYGAAPYCTNYIDATSPYIKSVSRYDVGDTASLTSPTGTTVIGSDPANLHTEYGVHGNVYINNNIVYDQSASWTSPDSIPSLKVIAYGGDIYIYPGVTELDGMYVAVPASTFYCNPGDTGGGPGVADCYHKDASTGFTTHYISTSHSAPVGGHIYTCAASPVTDPTNATQKDPYTRCDKQLVIYGSFAAKQVYFQRTRGINGSTYQANTGQRPPLSSGEINQPCPPYVLNSSLSCAAEVFVYSPEMWLDQPPAVLDTKYDSISSLPPIL